MSDYVNDHVPGVSVNARIGLIYLNHKRHNNIQVLKSNLRSSDFRLVVSTAQHIRRLAEGTDEFIEVLTDVLANPETHEESIKDLTETLEIFKKS